MTRSSFYANGSALGSMSRTHGYLRYPCNFDGHNTPAMLILVPGRLPILLSGMPFLMQLQTKGTPWFDDVRNVKPPLFREEIVSIFTENGIARRRIGYSYEDPLVSLAFPIPGKPGASRREVPTPLSSSPEC